ncbi:hypothetical protein [Halomonas maura]|nr:hypothetical protein [Halomonas maura]MDN3556229.1 hypothetical protein [Halomonas maura]
MICSPCADHPVARPDHGRDVSLVERFDRAHKHWPETKGLEERT